MTIVCVGSAAVLTGSRDKEKQGWDRRNPTNSIVNQIQQPYVSWVI